MKPTDEIPVIFADRLQSLNYSAPVPPSLFAAAGTLLDLDTGSITSTGLRVDGVTGDVAVRGDLDASSLTLLDTGGNIIATFDDTSTAYSLGTHALTLGTGDAVANQGLYWSGGIGSAIGLASRATSATLGELGTGLDIDPEAGATLDYVQASATPGQTIGARFRSQFLGANLAVATAAQASMSATGDTGSRALIESDGDVLVYGATDITLFADAGTVDVLSGLDVTGAITGASLIVAGLAAAADLWLDYGSVAAPSLAFTGDGNTGLYRIAADTLAVTAGGQLRLQVGATDQWRSNTPPSATNLAGASVGSIVGYESGVVRKPSTQSLTTSIAYLLDTYQIIAAKGRAYKLHVHGVADIGHTGGTTTNVVELWWRFNTTGSFALADDAKIITGAAAGYRHNGVQSWILDVPANTTVELRLYGVRIGGTSSSVYGVHTGYTWFSMG